MLSKEKRNQQVTGNIGLYYACYRLSRLGWNALPTSRNAKGIDIIVYDATCKHTRAIQVKTLSKRAPVPIGQSLERVMGDFWIIVTRAAGEESPHCYVMRPKEVKKFAHLGKSKKDGRISYWLWPTKYDKARYKEAWHRIGRAF